MSPNKITVPDSESVGHCHYEAEGITSLSFWTYSPARSSTHRISTVASTKLIAGAFRQAYAERTPCSGLIFHSDRGTQYASQSFQRLLLSWHVEQSFSRTGRPHDNAVAESFFASLKREELYRRNYRSVAEFRQAVDDYIVFYNTKRPHRTLNYKCPGEAYKIAALWRRHLIPKALNGHACPLEKGRRALTDE